ncbi:uncharacterized protein LOC101857969 [Aplysia californica]|uniref:Uncharacterized protein LOC101857969 n=1 Tax=Aplysia californica TaxID=6500 RepID=A0ABM1VY53_APLCA|nr:uncharacterized protein LOC101857969 [Aplysia californica]XP_035827346.1 uncharacterized protein LOC101857969 [Aplysia californica]
MASDLLDLEQLVKDFAEDFLDSDQKKHADLKTPEINWDHMNVHYGETTYDKSRDRPKPQAHVLFSAKFSNSTPKPQTYALRTERRTRSVCSITFLRTFTFGASVQIKLTPPNPVIEANTGFKSEVSKHKGTSQTFEQELSWTVDNSILVPPGYETKAELVIKENDYNGDFEELVTFEGRVMVTYEHKKTREHITTISENVRKLFDSRLGFKKDELGRPTFRVKGTCKCRFGMEQDVKLTETPMADPEPEDVPDTVQ